MTELYPGALCKNLDCPVCYPLVTRAGRLMTEDEIMRLTGEAERGYPL